ncbi:MAG: TIGR02206 family membrane protein [Candidatus Omnitrophota bacterium]
MTKIRPFGPDHWFVILFTLAAGLGLVLLTRPIRKLPNDRVVRQALALALLANQLSSWIFYITQGTVIAPLQLCDLVFFLIVWCLLTGGNQVTNELAFFWSIAGSSQAILTPDLEAAFPNPIWARFFISHVGMVLSAIYLVVRGNVKTTPFSIWRVWLFTNLYVIVAGTLNWRFGTNFGYLSRKPEQPSLLDHLGPWPYYIFWGEFIALGIYYLCYAFSRMVEKQAQSHWDL